jgi:hypothetical protein
MIRFVLAVGVIGCAYSLLAISFVAINLAGRKKMIGGTEGGTVLLICADVVSISSPTSITHLHVDHMYMYTDFLLRHVDE